MTNFYLCHVTPDWGNSNERLSPEKEFDLLRAHCERYERSAIVERCLERSEELETGALRAMPNE